jgi:acyl carrier protein
VRVTIEDVVGLVGLQLGLRYADPDDRLIEDLGAESADVVNILAVVEERYGVSIDEQRLAHIRTLRDLHDEVLRASPPDAPGGVPLVS